MVPKPSGEEFFRSYPGHASFAAEARRDLRALATRCGFGAQDVDDIGTAIGEVLVVAVQRTARPISAFLVVAKCDAEKIEIDVQSQSARFGVRTPVRNPELDSLAPRGMGMQLIRKLMTQVTFGDGGSRVHLVKRRSPERA